MPATNNKITPTKWGGKLKTETEFLKTSALENGQSIEGTVVAFRDSKIPATGKVVTNLVMRLANGDTRCISPSGNVAYAIRDGLFKVGFTYKIQREGTRKIKGMNSGVFGIYPLLDETSPPTDNNDI